MLDEPVPTPRRRFIGRLAMLATPAVALHLGASPARGAVAAAAGVDEPQPWLEALKGKHKTVLDVEQHRNGHALAQAKGLLDGWRDAFGVPEGEVNVVMGVRGGGVPIVLRDEAWRRFALGAHYEVADAATRVPAAHNVFTAAHVWAGGPVTAEQTVEALQRRGVLFLLCRNTVNGLARRLSAGGHGTPEAVGAELLEGVLPGVVVVPAMLIAFTQLQARGAAYVYAG
jgi:intracellular sulfur oxidation DsrE/DsrF family protein